MAPGFRHALLALMVIPIAGCLPTAQDRLTEEKRQLRFGLSDACLPRAFEKLSSAEVVRRTGLRPEKHLGYTGWLTFYRAPKLGLINLDYDQLCSFSVGERGARPEDVSALDQAIADDLAKDTRQWRRVGTDDLGRNWCDASNKVLVHTFESNPENPPPGIKAYIRRMQLQVRVRSDDGWFCSYLSRQPETWPPPAASAKPLSLRER